MLLLLFLVLKLMVGFKDNPIAIAFLLPIANFLILSAFLFISIYT